VKKVISAFLLFFSMVAFCQTLDLPGTKTARKMKQFENALESFFVDNEAYPMNINDLKPYLGAKTRNSVKPLNLKDGWGEDLIYEYAREGSDPRPAGWVNGLARGYTLLSKGPDRLRGTRDDIVVQRPRP
jgi:hypothetical protein